MILISIYKPLINLANLKEINIFESLIFDSNNLDNKGKIFIRVYFNKYLINNKDCLSKLLPYTSNNSFVDVSYILLEFRHLQYIKELLYVKDYEMINIIPLTCIIKLDFQLSLIENPINSMVFNCIILFWFGLK